LLSVLLCETSLGVRNEALPEKDLTVPLRHPPGEVQPTFNRSTTNTSVSFGAMPAPGDEEP
jgi:hypothetical protein